MSPARSTRPTPGAIPSHSLRRLTAAPQLVRQIHQPRLLEMFDRLSQVRTTIGILSTSPIVVVALPLTVLVPAIVVVPLSLTLPVPALVLMALPIAVPMLAIILMPLTVLVPALVVMPLPIAIPMLAIILMPLAVVIVALAVERSPTTPIFAAFVISMRIGRMARQAVLGPIAPLPPLFRPFIPTPRRRPAGTTLSPLLRGCAPPALHPADNLAPVLPTRVRTASRLRASALPLLLSSTYPFKPFQSVDLVTIIREGQPFQHRKSKLYTDHTKQGQRKWSQHHVENSHLGNNRNIQKWRSPTSHWKKPV